MKNANKPSSKAHFLWLLRAKWSIIVGFCILSVVLLANTNAVNSTGAPIGSTGAPGENSCAKSGCHTGQAINSGPGKIAINFGDSILNYTPGETYDIILSIAQDSIERFGFSVVALGTDNNSLGTFMVAEHTRTQILNGINQYSGREYITYKSMGTNPYSSGLGQWKFKWKAPDTNEGSVTFYMAAVAANNDGTDFGDQVYTKSLSLNGTLHLSETSASSKVINVFPNPATRQVNMSFHAGLPSLARVSLYDMKANKIDVLWQEYTKSGLQTIAFEIPETCPKGLYMLKLELGHQVLNYKISVQ